MNITNLHLRNLIRWALSALLFLVIADVVMVLFFTDFLDALFTGYSTIVVPLLILGAYAYVGFPIFSFDDTSTILQIRSHSGLTGLLGKELRVHKRNIVKFEIDRKRLRKKLRVTYLDSGQEFTESFSITLLGTSKVRALAQKVELIESEVKGKGGSHLFI